jgi:homocitrate synthase NifV
MMHGLIDSTLREGSQTFGLSFSLIQKKAIFTGLCRTNIEEIEIGLATPFDEDLPELIKFSREYDSNRRIALWCRCRRDDILFAASLKPDVLSLSIPVSDLHIEQRLGRDRVWALAAAKEAIVEARRCNFKTISLGLEDATRAEISFLDEMVKTAIEAGVDRLRLADTVGIAAPFEIINLVKKIKSFGPIEVGVHMHNDFGMATANSLAAFDAGADWADVTVLGLGERAGNARLEELAGYLALRRKTGYRLEAILELAKIVAAVSGRTISPHMPILGDKIFYCETGLHLQGLEKDPSTYEPFSPESVGACRKLRFGSKIGRRALLDCLRDMNINRAKFDITEMIRKGRQKAEAIGRPLEKEEMLTLINS